MPDTMWDSLVTTMAEKMSHELTPLQAAGLSEFEVVKIGKVLTRKEVWADIRNERRMRLKK